MGLMSRLAKIARKPAPEPRPVILEFPPQEPDRWLKMDEKTLAVWSELLPAGLALHEERHDRVSLAGSVASKIVFNGIKALTDLLESKVQAVAAAKEKGDLTSLARLEALRDGVSALLLDTAARTARSWMTQVSEGPRGDSVRSAYALLAEKIRLVEPHAAGSPDLQARLTECSKLRDGARAALTAGGRGAVAAALEAVQSGGKIGVLESELTALHQFIGRHFPGSAEHAALAQDAAGACAKIRLTFLERDLSNALAGLPRLQAAKPGEIPSAELRDLHHAAGAVEEAASCRGRHAKTGLLAATPPPEETAILDQLATLGPKLQAELDRLGFDPFAL
jgi:hypothetical protein